MKSSLVLILILFFSTGHTILSAQDFEVDGSAKITVMEPATISAQPVGREADGTLSLMNAAAPTYAVGDFAQGGVVFWVTASGEHGRVACLYNVANASWSTYTTEIGNSSRSEINGAGNSVAIALHSADSISAAKQCLYFAYAGYDDWYLPAKNELNQMYNNRLVINATSEANGGEAFLNAGYWSSTESDADPTEAWNHSFFGGGNQQADSKTVPFNFRAMRAF